ncbi:hypothetical protein BGW38_001386, partial [Lunasporangiospora selenospora]
PPFQDTPYCSRMETGRVSPEHACPQQVQQLDQYPQPQDQRPLESDIDHSALKRLSIDMLPQDTNDDPAASSAALRMPSPPTRQSSQSSGNNTTATRVLSVSTAQGQIPQLVLEQPSPMVPMVPMLQDQAGKNKEHLPPDSSRPSSAVSSVSGQGRGQRSYMMPEIPSAADLFTAAPGGGTSGARATSRFSHSKSHSVDSSGSVRSSGHSSVNESKHRFERLPNGAHRHNLSAPKRHQFLSNQVRRLKELLEGGKREKDDDRHQPSPQQGHHLSREFFEHPLSLLNEKIKDFEDDVRHSPGGGKKNHSLKDNFEAKYGDLQQVVGKGAFGTVRLSIKKNPETGEEAVFAIKASGHKHEFKYNHGESPKSYMRRLTSEFCIASTLKHINIIQTLDLLQLHGDSYSEVMEYCVGGDLHTLIASANTLTETESSCFFAQLINGVAYLHSLGVVHRDLKPENLLLTANGCIKIADFGNSEVFRMPWEKKARMSTSVRGSGPFIAPEEFIETEFDARKVDMWSCGIIYICMRVGRYMWAEASKGDPIWESFLRRVNLASENQESILRPSPKEQHRKGKRRVNITAIEVSTHLTLAWPDNIAAVIDRLLEPNPKARWHAAQAIESDWMQNVDNCHPGELISPQELDGLEDEPISSAPSRRVGSKVLDKSTDVMGMKIADEAMARSEQEKKSAG